MSSPKNPVNKHIFRVRTTKIEVVSNTTQKTQ